MCNKIQITENALLKLRIGNLKGIIKHQNNWIKSLKNRLEISSKMNNTYDEANQYLRDQVEFLRNQVRDLDESIINKNKKIKTLETGSGENK